MRQLKNTTVRDEAAHTASEEALRHQVDIDPKAAISFEDL